LPIPWPHWAEQQPWTAANGWAAGKKRCSGKEAWRRQGTIAAARKQGSGEEGVKLTGAGRAWREPNPQKEDLPKESPQKEDLQEGSLKPGDKKAWRQEGLEKRRPGEKKACGKQP
jgi:hypothetical protein